MGTFDKTKIMNIGKSPSKISLNLPSINPKKTTGSIFFKGGGSGGTYGGFGAGSFSTKLSQKVSVGGYGNIGGGKGEGYKYKFGGFGGGVKIKF